MKNRNRYIVGAIILTAAAVLVRAFVAFPEQKLKKVQAGMSMQEVVTLVGKPESVFTNGGFIYWDYTKPLALGYGGVKFNETNRLAICAPHEEL